MQVDRTGGVTGLCPAGRPDPAYHCRFCGEAVHRGDSGCGCSELRRETTLYASLCRGCAAAVDTLTADTAVGRVHRALVHEADCRGRPSDDD